MNGLELIENDLFDIALRLKEIDPEYKLFRNRAVGRFEIYAKGALQIAVPYKRLDARTLKLARETRLEYAERLVAEMDKKNAELDRARAAESRDKIMEEVERVL